MTKRWHLSWTSLPHSGKKKHSKHRSSVHASVLLHSYSSSHLQTQSYACSSDEVAWWHRDMSKVTRHQEKLKLLSLFHLLFHAESGVYVPILAPKDCLHKHAGFLGSICPAISLMQNKWKLPSSYSDNKSTSSLSCKLVSHSFFCPPMGLSISDKLVSLPGIVHSLTAPR